LVIPHASIQREVAAEKKTLQKLTPLIPGLKSVFDGK
jgi:hypothetical protein